MHNSSEQILLYFPTHNGVFLPLDRRATNRLRESAANDAGWMYRSAVLSLVSAINSIESGYRSWPFVKLYYSLFYSVKSILYSNNLCIYYCDGKPMQIALSLGEIPHKITFKGANSSHIAAFKIFQTKFPAHPLIGQINLVDSFAWMRSFREKINYNDNKMNYDDQHQCFRRFEKGSRTAISTYLSDLSLYAFLPEDAAVALPMYACTLASSSLPDATREEIKPFIQEIVSRTRDRTGVIASFSKFIP